MIVVLNACFLFVFYNIMYSLNSIQGASHHQDAVITNLRDSHDNDKMVITNRELPILKNKIVHDDHLIFIMGIPIPGRAVFILKWVKKVS